MGGPEPDWRHDPPAAFDPVEETGREQAGREVAALTRAIRHHDRKYHVENDPEIAGSVHDRLFRRLEALEEACPDLAERNSPTRRVGAPPAEALERAEQVAPMLSLEAALEEAERAHVLRRLREATGEEAPALVAEPKFDGLSLEVVDKDGAFVRAVTRGDGRMGEAVSDDARTIRTLPLALTGDPPAVLAVRAEAFLHKDRVHALNRRRIARGEEPFANPRNAAGGTIRRLEPRAVAKARLDIRVYDVRAVEGTAFASAREALGRLCASRPTRRPAASPGATGSGPFARTSPGGATGSARRRRARSSRRASSGTWPICMRWRQRISSRSRASPGPPRATSCGPSGRRRARPSTGSSSRSASAMWAAAPRGCRPGASPLSRRCRRPTRPASPPVPASGRRSPARSSASCARRATARSWRSSPVAGSAPGPSRQWAARGRAGAEAAVERLGARATGSVSSSTDYVVVGADPGARRDEARERGIETLDEAAFGRLIEDPG